jgi:hypothetical protein
MEYPTRLSMMKIGFSLLLFVCSLLAGCCANRGYHTPYIISDVSDKGGERHDSVK